MAATALCTNCGAVLSENPDEDPEKQASCPQCGSKLRNYSVTISGHARLRAKNVTVNATGSVTPPIPPAFTNSYCAR
jgi:predicted  nucleic acid-binding Zn-ribbon protein